VSILHCFGDMWRKFHSILYLYQATRRIPTRNNTHIHKTFDITRIFRTQPAVYALVEGVKFGIL